MAKYQFVTCTIERSGFSSERAFKIPLPNNERIVGTAFFEHFLDGKKQSLDEDTPEYGEEIKGFVKCRVIREETDGSKLIEVPSADLIVVSADELVEHD